MRASKHFTSIHFIGPVVRLECLEVVQEANDPFFRNHADVKVQRFFPAVELQFIHIL